MKTLIAFVTLTSILVSCTVSNNSVKSEERYCIVVEEVKKGRRGATIRPKSQVAEIKKINYWYRYPTPNVFVGDTVDVSSKQIITGPRF